MKETSGLRFLRRAKLNQKMQENNLGNFLKKYSPKMGTMGSRVHKSTKKHVTDVD